MPEYSESKKESLVKSLKDHKSNLIKKAKKQYRNSFDCFGYVL